MTPNLAKTQFNLEQAITYDPLIVSSETLLTEVLVLMSATQISCTLTENTDPSDSSLPEENSNCCVLVVDNHVLVGLFTEQNLIRLSAERKSLIGVRIGEVMASSVITLYKSQFNSVFVALNLLQQHQIRYLPLLDDHGKVIGLITYESLRKLLRPVELLRLRLIAEVMTQNVIHATTTASLLSVIELMAKYGVSSVVIVTEQEQNPGSHNLSLNHSPLLIPVGIITAKDVVQFHTLKLDLEQVQAQAVMSRRIFALTAQNSLWSARLLMEQKQIRYILVTGNQGELQGILSQSTLLQLLNPTEIYKQVKLLTTKINRLEREKLELLERRNAELETAVQQRTQELKYQAQQERLLADVAGRIRSSLNLQEILDVSVMEMRKLLECDRVLVYQFLTHDSGKVVAESVATGWTPSLYHQIDDPCFQANSARFYLQGQYLAVANVHEVGYSECYQQMLAQYQVKSNLVVPILVEHQLWGLLIGHQCAKYSPWEESNLEILERLAVQIAIAIQQAKAYEKSQTELQERLKAESALRESEKLFRTTFEQAAVGMSHTALDGQFLLVNQSYCQILGYSEAELLSLNYQSITHPEDLAADVEGIKKLLSGEIQTINRETRYIRKDGTVVWGNLTVTLLRSSTGKPKHFIVVLQDINDRKIAEASLKALNQKLATRVKERTLALQQSEQRFLTLFTAAPDFIYLLDMNGIILEVNRAVLEKSGYSENELIGQQNLSFYSLPSQQLIIDRIPILLANGTDEKEVEFISKNGSIHILNCSASIVYNTESQPEYILLIQKDITERKQTEKNLLCVTQLQTAILDGVDYSIISTSVDGIIQTFNAAAQTKLGYKPEEVIGIHTPALIHDPEKLQQRAITLSQELGRPIAPDFEVFTIKAREGVVNEEEWPYIRKDGSRFPVLLSVTALRDAQNNITGFVGIAKDITHQKQSDEALQKTLKELSDFKYAMDQASIVAITDPKGIITYANENFCRISEYSQTELIGNTHRLVNSNYHPPQFFTNLWSTITSGQVWRGEICNRTKSGTNYWVYSTIVPFLDGQGNPLQYLAIRADISHRKRMEDDLRQRNDQLAIANEKLEIATKSKDEFLANMSHELRTPLNAILGMAEALQDHIFGEINPQQRRAVETIERSGKHLLALINDILDLTKIASGKLQLHPAAVSVFYLCQSSITLVRQQAIQKGLDLRVNVPEGLADIYVDQRYMCQVLTNLLSNAIKFTPEGGNISLVVKLEPAWTQVNQTTAIQFSVMDTGIGIAPENIHKLFQYFVQIDTKLNRQYSGTGLGLALVKQITELHGGSISVESTLGQGSCFTVKLPYQPAPQQLLTTDNQSPTRDENEHHYSRLISNTRPVNANALILLVEDNEANISTVSDYLISRGYRLLVARSVTEAITLAQTQTPQLILMDIQMPGMDGLEASRQIRANKSLENIPIIALTALAMPGDREQCIQAGINEYLSKPVRLKQLVDTIQSFLDKSQDYKGNIQGI
ncbi:PAS domain S-box protein [Anabaena azotica]|uniref:PAS domain S-box protein n=1 Tax=Anabaena azotica TaxID=197653 RepID=UPI0039A6DEC7